MFKFSRKQNITTKIRPVRPNSQSKSSEILLEKDLTSVLKPISILQTMALASKCIISRKISAYSSFYSVASIIVTFVLFFVTLYSMFKPALSKSNSLNNFLYVQFLTDIISLTSIVMFVVNESINFVYRGDHLRLIIDISDLYRALKVYGSFKTLVCSNWVYIVTYTVYHISWMGFYFYRFKLPALAFNYSIYFYTCMDLHIIYTTNIIMLMRKLLQIWVKKFETMTHGYKSNFVPQDRHDWNLLFKMYVKILETFKFFHVFFQKWVCSVLLFVILLIVSVFMRFFY